MVLPRLRTLLKSHICNVEAVGVKDNVERVVEYFNINGGVRIKRVRAVLGEISAVVGQLKMRLDGELVEQRPNVGWEQNSSIVFGTVASNLPRVNIWERRTIAGVSSNGRVRIAERQQRYQDPEKG